MMDIESAFPEQINKIISSMQDSIVKMRIYDDAGENIIAEVDLSDGPGMPDSGTVTKLLPPGVKMHCRARIAFLNKAGVETIRALAGDIWRVDWRPDPLIFSDKPHITPCPRPDYEEMGKKP